MQRFLVSGGVPLRGEVRISGAKNAALKMMAAATLTEEPCVLRNVPRISDVSVMRETMTDIGFDVRETAPDTFRIEAREADWLFVPLEAAAKSRSSFILLGPLLTRFGRVIISNPGGDRIGRRPVNLHVDAMATLGAQIEYKNGYYFAQAERLRGATISFPYITVMGTENALLAAVLAEGQTVIENAAQEPEVDNLIAMLCAMGARIQRVEPRRLVIDGVERLHGTEHTVIGDRIEAGTFAVAAALTDGEVTLRGADPSHLGAFLDVLGRVGVSYETDGDPDDGLLRVCRSREVRPVEVETQPYPGFATDLQAPLAVLLTQADGESCIHETIYEDRLEYTAELNKMGARIRVPDERRAMISGPTPLSGSELRIPDLRAGATLILAALAARGTSAISGIEHVDRGYERIESKLVGLGASIQRVED